jgi:hypothetical protein
MLKVRERSDNPYNKFSINLIGFPKTIYGIIYGILDFNI